MLMSTFISECQITDRPGDCRVRKDFYSMSSQERERFIQVFKLVTTQPPYKRLYDNLIAIHEREFDNGIHSPQQFLPWHRWFVVAVENLLRCADPTMTIPYWDYSYTCRSPWDPNVCLDNLWGDNVRSIGGNGTGRFHHVATGPFGYPGWRLTPSAETDALRRSFRGRELPCLPAIQRFLSLPCNSGILQVYCWCARIMLGSRSAAVMCPSVCLPACLSVCLSGWLSLFLARVSMFLE